MMQSSDAAGIRSSIGVFEENAYPYVAYFSGTTALAKNLTSITSSSGFYTNGGLTSIYIGSKVTSIGSNAFYYTASLSDVIVAEGLTSIGNSAFIYSGLTSIKLPNTLTSIGSGAFNYSSLLSIIVPNSVTTIGSGAFSYCSIASVTFPINDNFTSIPASCCLSNNLTGTLVIPSSITSIGSSAFRYTNVTRINCLATTAPTLGSNVFNGISATIHVPVGATGYGTTYGGLTVIADL